MRRITKNVSELKRMTAHEFEDILQVREPFPHQVPRDDDHVLQCSIAVFGGLLPEPHNTDILRMLFVCGHWHALAKLRMHNEPTMEIFEEETRRLAVEITRFRATTCEAFETRELPKEAERRQRRRPRNVSGNAQAEAPSSSSVSAQQSGLGPPEIQLPSSSGHAGLECTRDRPPPTRESGPLAQVAPEQLQNCAPTQSAGMQGLSGQPAQPARGSKKVLFSLCTYKFHALGDYPSTIREYGTTDSYTTEIVSTY